ncbi:MAG: hypothetical protein ACYC1D_18385 [Acidimicrobiales bacterium]
MPNPSLRLNDPLVGLPEWLMQAMAETHLSLTEVITLLLEGRLPWVHIPNPNPPDPAGAAALAGSAVLQIAPVVDAGRREQFSDIARGLFEHAAQTAGRPASPVATDV